MKIAFVAFFIAAFVSTIARGATVVVANPTEEEYANVLSTSAFSWSARFESGYTTSSTPEITVITNALVARSHSWTTPQQVGVLYDEAGNLIVWAGSTSITVQPMAPFNAVLVRVGDRAFFSTSTQFKNIQFDGTSTRDMFADDGNTFITDSDYQMFFEVGDTFSLIGDFYKSPLSAGSESQLEIYGVYVVPEPASMFLSAIGCMVLLMRRTRSAGFYRRPF